MTQQLSDKQETWKRSFTFVIVESLAFTCGFVYLILEKWGGLLNGRWIVDKQVVFYLVKEYQSLGNLFGGKFDHLIKLISYSKIVRVLWPFPSMF